MQIWASNTWLAQYNAPCTQPSDTDIAGHSIIQLSSKAVPDSFKSAWRSAAKQSPRQRSTAFITQTHSTAWITTAFCLPPARLPEHRELGKGEKHACLPLVRSNAPLSLSSFYSDALGSASLFLAVFSLHSLCLLLAQGSKATIKFNPKLHLQTQAVTYAVILDTAWDYQRDIYSRADGMTGVVARALSPSVDRLLMTTAFGRSVQQACYCAHTSRLSELTGLSTHKHYSRHKEERRCHRKRHCLRAFSHVPTYLDL